MKIQFLLLFGLLQFAVPQQQIPYGSNPLAGHYLAIDDIKIYYEIYGRGHPLLLMHGNGGSIASFSKFIPLLSKHFLVIAVDSRAQGRSGDSDKALTFKLLAADMKKLLDELHQDSVYAVGWSDGGIVGLQMAYSYPQTISKLVCIGANYKADSTAMSADFFDTTKIVWFNNLPAVEKQSIRQNSHFPDRAGIIYDKLINLDLKYPNFTIEQLRTITTPTLVVAGDRDIIKDIHTLALYHALAHSQLFIVPGTPHHVPIAKPILLDEVVTDFFNH